MTNETRSCTKENNQAPHMQEYVLSLYLLDEAQGKQ